MSVEDKNFLHRCSEIERLLSDFNISTHVVVDKKDWYEAITYFENKRNNCLNCIHFTSYETIYEDEFEPHDLGLCENKESENFGDNQVSESVMCIKHKLTP